MIFTGVTFSGSGSLDSGPLKFRGSWYPFLYEQETLLCVGKPWGFDGPRDFTLYNEGPDISSQFQ